MIYFDMDLQKHQEHQQKSHPKTKVQTKIN